MFVITLKKKVINQDAFYDMYNSSFVTFIGSSTLYLSYKDSNVIKIPTIIEFETWRLQ